MAADAGLKLRAADQEDLAVISACLQDALVSVRDLAYDPDARTFMFVANRFRWEGGRPGGADVEPGFERVHCAVVFDEVDQATYRGFRRSEEDRILSLLAIRSRPASRGTAIDLIFAAGGAIRLGTTALQCRLRDCGEPWPTVWYPDHPLDEHP